MTQQINCLRCKFCKLLPETDLTKRSTNIHCGKLGVAKAINYEGCPKADPRPYRFRLARTKTTAHLSGDKLTIIGQAEAAFLRTWYADLSWDTLERLTQRTRSVLKHYAGRYGLKRANHPHLIIEAYRRAEQSRAENGQDFTPAQHDFIMQCFARPDWPSAKAGRDSPSHEHRQRIVDAVNALSDNGKVWAWESIRIHTKWWSPGYKERLAFNRAKRQKQRASTCGGEA